MPSPLWLWIDRYFIPEHLRKEGLALGKARLLTLIHIVSIFFCIIFSILNLTILPQEGYPTFSSLAASIAMPVIFWKKGSFVVSGNIVSFVAFAILSSNLLNNGCVHSDDFHWMIFCPFIAALFCGTFSTIFWYLTYSIVGFFLAYKYENGLHDHGMPFDVIHYLVSYYLLAGVVTLIGYLYKRGENLIFESMRNYQMNLEKQRQELTLKTTELHRVGEKLARTNRELQAFAYSAGHDLKEPLRMIAAYSQLLNKRIGNSLSPENQEFMGYIIGGSVQMQRLLDDLLKFSGIGSGKDKPSMVDLDDVIYYVRSNLKLSIEESNAEIITPVHLPHVFARYSEMVQLLQNLIANALKFRQKDKTPVIHIDCIESPENEGFYQISVCDNGIGIHPDFQSKVFAPFEKFHARTDYEGTGLGLAICQKIVETYGGSIHLESTLGEGTKFVFELPKGKSPSFQHNGAVEMVEMV